MFACALPLRGSIYALFIYARRCLYMPCADVCTYHALMSVHMLQILVAHEVLADVFVSYCRSGGTLRQRFDDLHNKASATIRRCKANTSANSRNFERSICKSWQLSELGKRKEDDGREDAQDDAPPMHVRSSRHQYRLLISPMFAYLCICIVCTLTTYNI